MLSLKNLFDLGRLLLVCMLLISPFFVSAAGNAKLLERAEESFYDEDLETAFQLFSEYLKGDPTNAKAQYHAEICSLLTYYPTKSLDKLFELEKTIGARDKFYNYWMGRVYAARYDFTSAISSWNTFLDKKVYKSKEIVDETKKFIADAERKQFYVENGLAYRIYQLADNINTEHIEMGPVLSNSGAQLLVSRVVYEGKRPAKSELLALEKTATKNWSLQNDADKSLELPSDKVLVQSLKNSSELLVMGIGKKGGFYTTKLSKDGWGPLVEMEIIANATSAVFSDSGEDVFFSAASASGPNQTDLYQSSRDLNGKWSAPRVLGSVSSVMDESNPFLSSDGKTLYFSSKGYGGMGGFDIYKSTLDSESGKWGDPINLGFPINTPADELFFSLNADSKTGFLASSRAGSKGLLDTYFFMEEIKRPLKGRVLVHGINKPVSGIVVNISAIDENKQLMAATSGEGGYFEVLMSSGLEYKLEFYLEGQLVKSELVELPYGYSDINTIEQTFEIDIPQSMLVDLNTQNEEGDSELVSEYTEIEDLGQKFSKGNKASLDKIYFEPGSDYVSSEYTPQLNALYQLMKENPLLKIEIVGYSDGGELSDQEKNLSLLRARSIGSYLIQRKIDYRRIREVGYQSARGDVDEMRSIESSARRIEVQVLQ